MRYREIIRTLGIYLLTFTGVLCVPTLVAIYYQVFAADSHPQPHSAWAFLLTVFVCLAIAGAFLRVGRQGHGNLYRREGLVVVVAVWFLSAIIAGLPFYFSGTLRPVDAYFEAMSGLTTTGASIMHPKEFDPDTGEEVLVRRKSSQFYGIEYEFYGTIDPVVDPDSGELLYEGVEAVGKGLLFWRSFMQWLGGMGIVVLFVAVLPALGVGGKVLFQSEVPGPLKESLQPRIAETASLLWKLYLGFTVAEVFLLKWTNAQMPWFDAVAVTFSNLSTGGFSVRNSSIAAYANGNTEWVIGIFMVVGSINFSLYFHALRGKFYRILEPEFVVYLAILIGACLFSAWHLLGEEAVMLSGETKTLGLADSLRYGFFHSISAQTSTGFATMDFDRWPFVNQLVLLVVMYIGSMSGSTGGGIKVIRHCLLFKVAQNRVESIFRPDAVRPVRLGQVMIDRHTATTVLVFILVVLSLAVLGTLLLTIDGVDLETALAVNSCMINNIGLAFRMGGPTESFAFLSVFGKLLSTTWMVLGRLEFFAVLVILVPAFWRD